jgi:hypothetical protein
MKYSNRIDQSLKKHQPHGIDFVAGRPLLAQLQLKTKLKTGLLCFHRKQNYD